MSAFPWRKNFRVRPADPRSGEKVLLCDFPRWGIARTRVRGFRAATTHEAPPSASIDREGRSGFQKPRRPSAGPARAKRFRIMVHECTKASGAWRSGTGVRVSSRAEDLAPQRRSGKPLAMETLCGGSARIESTPLPGGDRRVATDQHARSEKKPAGRTESLRDVEPVDDPLHLHLLLRRFLRRISMGPRRVVRHRRLLRRRLRLLLRRRAHGLDQ